MITTNYRRLNMKNLLNKFSSKANLNRIIIVANVYGETTHYVCPKEQLRIEFFNEREINEIKNSLRNAGYNFITYYDEHKFIQDVELNKITIQENDLIFNLSRNGKGISKKSLIPTYCDYYDFKYTGSCGYACSLARNKKHVSELLIHNNLHGLKSWGYNGKWQLNCRPQKDMEVIIKPLYESASRGIKSDCIINTSNDNFEKIVENKYIELNVPLVVQQFIRGFECKVPIFVLDDITVFEPIGICINDVKYLNDKIITQDLSYHYSYEDYLLSECFPKSVIEDIKINARKIFELIGMENYGRIDCRITQDGDFYFYDFATMPYFTEHSELTYLFKKYELNQSALFNVIFNSALITKYNYNV